MRAKRPSVRLKVRAAERLREIEAAAAELKDASGAHEEMVADLERRMSRFDARRSAAVEMIARFLDGQPLLAARPMRPDDAADFIASQRRASDPPTAGDLSRDEFDELTTLLAELNDRRQHIRQTESLLARAQSEVAELHQSLLAERKQFYAQRQSEHRRQEEHDRRAEGELAARRETLEAASQQLELRRAAVDQMRAELTIAQRETLEDRLAAEELLAQLAGAVPPAELSRQIARTKARLVDSYRLRAGKRRRRAPPIGERWRFKSPGSTSDWQRKSASWNSGLADGKRTSPPKPLVCPNARPS